MRAEIVPFEPIARVRKGHVGNSNDAVMVVGSHDGVNSTRPDKHFAVQINLIAGLAIYYGVDWMQLHEENPSLSTNEEGGETNDTVTLRAGNVQMVFTAPEAEELAAMLLQIIEAGRGNKTHFLEEFGKAKFLPSTIKSE